MNPITEFHELCCPRQDGSNVGVTGDWVAFDTDVKGHYYLLTNGSFTIADIIRGSGYTNKDIYFETEWECHVHVERYYQTHGEDYPYYAEWARIEQSTAVKSEEVHSEIMRFE